MKKMLFLFLLLPLQVFAFGRANPELETVSYVDLDRYLGKWYEIGSFPQSFSEGCTDTTAKYSKNEDGTIQVLNECLVEGKLKAANGKAKVVDTVTQAKLKVSFFWPFYGDYWILELGENYDYAVVGNDSREYLWILSRTPIMSSEKIAAIRERMAQKQFDMSKLLLTSQNAGR